MAIGIIIPVWNLWEEMTFPCLRSLVKETNLADIHVYLVDNASTDNTATYAERIGQELFGKDKFTYIKNEQNLGFAIACNQGAEQAKKDGHEFLLFLNNDTVVTKNWLPPLVKALENPRVGIVGPLLLYPQDNTVQHCGVVFTPLSKVMHIYAHFPHNHPIVLKKRKFRVITGAVMLCRTQEFFECGKFYDEYKNGIEDIDLCYSYVERGFMNQVVTESIVYHFTSQTPGRLDQNANLKNGLIFSSRKKNITLDAHLYYHQDGYIPALTTDFIFYGRLQEEKRKEFNKIIQQNYSEKLCLELLQKEPFWHDGYQILIQNYKKQKNWEKALTICQKTLSFCFNRHNLQQFIDIAKLSNNKAIIDEVCPNTQMQLDEMPAKQKAYAEKFKENLGHTEWYQRLLNTQELDNTNFGEF